MMLAKRALAIVLAVLLAVGCLSVAALAAGEAEAAAPAETAVSSDSESPYSLTVADDSGLVNIKEDATPLAAGPTIETCCMLHFLLMLCALGVAIYYTHDQKKRQARIFEMAREIERL